MRGDGARPQRAAREARRRRRYEPTTSPASWPSTGSTFHPDRDSRPADRSPAPPGLADGIADGILSPEMPGELRRLMDDLLRDDRLRWDMARLAGDLQALRPDTPFGEPYRSVATSPWDCPRRWPRSIGSSSSTPWRRSCWPPATPTPGADRREGARGLGGDEAIGTSEQLRALTRALEEAGTWNARRPARAHAARSPQVRDAGPDRHLQPAARASPSVATRCRHRGPAASRRDETKPLEHGDPFAVDLNRTLFNAMARTGPGTPVRMAPTDFEVYRSEETTVSSTVLSWT